MWNQFSNNANIVTDENSNEIPSYWQAHVITKNLQTFEITNNRSTIKITIDCKTIKVAN
jgi:hypothetical protein